MKTYNLLLYKPHRKQLEFHQSKKRYRVAAFGRQSGKSTACLNELLKRAWDNPGKTYWFLSPTYDQAKNQYRRLVGMLWNCGDIMLKKNQTELRVKLINQSQIIFKSGESLDNLRGSTLDGAVIDEVRDQHKDLWPMVIRPMLATTKGWAAFVSTPNGYDQFYDLFEFAKANPEEWDCFQAPSTCNPLITEDELSNAKKTMSDAQFAQEYLADFRELHNGSAYVNFSAANESLTSPFFGGELPYSNYISISLALDFNITPMSWAIGQHNRGISYWFDEIHLEKSHTQEAALELIGRLKKMNLKAKPNLIIVGDATGNASQRAAAGKSDYAILLEMLDEAKITYENRTPDSNPRVKDRVNVMNARLKDAVGNNHIFIHPKNCPYLKKDLHRVAWKKGASMILDQTTDPMLTHMSDAVGYFECEMHNMWTPPTGGLHMIRRS